MKRNSLKTLVSDFADLAPLGLLLVLGNGWLDWVIGTYGYFTAGSQKVALGQFKYTRLQAILGSFGVEPAW